jgi:hypothetical protein
MECPEGDRTDMTSWVTMQRAVSLVSAGQLKRIGQLTACQLGKEQEGRGAAKTIMKAKCCQVR